VTNAFHVLLNRDPDAGGLAAFQGALQAGMDDAQMIAAIASSQEFFNNSPPPFSLR